MQIMLHERTKLLSRQFFVLSDFHGIMECSLKTSFASVCRIAYKTSTVNSVNSCMLV